jgi:hypothetical protein
VAVERDAAQVIGEPGGEASLGARPCDARLPRHRDRELAAQLRKIVRHRPLPMDSRKGIRRELKRNAASSVS